MNLSRVQLAPPQNWQDFESLCCDLWRLIWNDPYAKKHGRSGQQQMGVDISGNIAPGVWAGVQCKVKKGGKVTLDELNREVEKAKQFKPSLSLWILATTARKDAGLELRAREITDQHHRDGLFRVEIFAWDDIAEHLGNYPQLVRQYYPELFPPAPTGNRRAQTWIKEFLTPLIDASEEIFRKFESKEFWGRLQGISRGEYYWVIDFVDLNAWRRLTTNRTAAQFLKSYEDIAARITRLENDSAAFAGFIDATIKSILDDEKITEIIRQRFQSHLDGLKRQDNNQKNVVELLRELYGGMGLQSLASEDARITFFTSNFLAYSVFDFEMGFSNGCWQDPCLWNFCSELIDEIGIDYFRDIKEEMESLRQSVISESNELYRTMTDLRDRLSDEYDLTYD